MVIHSSAQNIKTIFALFAILAIFRRITPRDPLQRHLHWHAVAFSLKPAALVTFQQHQPSQPLHKNVNSVALAERPARQIGGSGTQLC